MEDLGPVRRLGLEDLPQAVEVLVDSFFRYPVMRFVLDGESPGYESRLRKLITFFARARLLREELVLGLWNEESLGATALVSRPGGGESPAELGELRERLWSELGPSARSRYESFGAACAPFRFPVSRLHLNMIGVHGDARGLGLGRRLLEEVHRLSEEDTTSRGVSLTTEDEANIGLYRHFGYELIGEARVTPWLTTWGFFRADP